MNSVYIVEEHLPIREIRSVLKEYMVKGRVIPANLHRPCDCFVYVSGGKVAYHFEEQTVIVQEGDIVFLSKGSTYHYDVLSETYDYIYLDFDFSYGDGRKAECRAFSMTREQDNCYYLFDRMYKHWLLQDAGYYEQCMADVYQIYSKVIQCVKAPSSNTSGKKLSTRAAVYIAQNCTREDFRLGDVAKEVMCSEVHLRRVFNRDFGMSPSAYVTKVRLDRAKSLLTHTQYSIMMISDMTGFNDAFYFSRVFKQAFGCTPTEYRGRY